MKKGNKNLVPMFVYGTLRPNTIRSRDGSESSWGWNGTDKVIRNVTINGNLWYISGEGSFPVAKLDTDGTIIGDVIMYDRTSGLYHHVCDVEYGAGYDMIEVEATLSDGSTQMVMAWHWEGNVSKRRPVPGNDWVRAQMEEDESYA